MSDRTQTLSEIEEAVWHTLSKRGWFGKHVDEAEMYEQYRQRHGLSPQPPTGEAARLRERLQRARVLVGDSVYESAEITLSDNALFIEFEAEDLDSITLALPAPSDSQGGQEARCGGSRTHPDRRGATSAAGCSGCPDCVDPASTQGEGDKPAAAEIKQMLADIRTALFGCQEAIVEDPGCVDPDRAAVPFEDLDAEVRRLMRAMGLASLPAAVPSEPSVLEELAVKFEREAEMYARRRAKCKADEDADRASGKLGNGTYEATWNYYEGLARAYEWAASLCREKAAALKGGEAK